MTFAFFIIVSSLLWSWLKHRYGVFEERGFKRDPFYPETFLSGNGSYVKQNRGCKNKNDNYCPLKSDSVYDREAPNRQNVACFGASAIETVLADQDFKVGFVLVVVVIQ